ncbi:MAG: excinuclease ABC subunit UvrC [Candidatus Cyclobacteriaceae bacterium M3_2C_046]
MAGEGMETPIFFTRDQVLQLPDKPGIYKFYDQTQTLIYVGKAKSIKKRVSSYFNHSVYKDRKTKKMVSEVNHIEVTIVNSEFDALLLENNLIKSNHPKYNIMLRDDKTFPYICVTNETFPRIYATRRVEPEKGTYFGPYASVRAMNNVLDLIRNLYFIRTCKLNLQPDTILAGKFKICLDYHIGKCKGPCEGLQSGEDYRKDVEQAVNILKGNINLVKNYFKEKMQLAASQMEFERAQEFKIKLELLDKFQSKSVVVNQKIDDTDVFTIVSDQKSAFVNFLKIKSGAITITQTVEVKKKLNETDADILSLLMVDLRSKYESKAPEILTNVALEETYDLNIIQPKIGDKKKLVDLSIKNALFYKKERLKYVADQDPREIRILKSLQGDLHLKNLPKQIECFDNSNLQGSNPVASMVCFINAKPAKKEYRKFNIKTVEGPNDFASMKEIVFRRYHRLIIEEKNLPDLIVIDGGKGQLSSAVEALKELDIYGKIAIVGIAKKLEEIYFPEDQIPLHINKKSESLKLLQKVRDEAHRFAITFHRQKRSKASFSSDLEHIKGIGKKSVDKLLQNFRSIKNIRNADFEQLKLLIGADKAKLLQDHLKQENYPRS